jgi:hypothetical protein
MWKPMPESTMLSLVEAAEHSLPREISYFWTRIRIRPQKWALSPWGDEGGGFWVVAVLGQECLWYNDIEEGFNYSQCLRFGEIASYQVNQSTLEQQIEHLYRQMMDKFEELRRR